MNTKTYLNSKSTRFSTEIEGEGMELCLRGFLVACLLSALAICNLSITGSHRAVPASAAVTVALAKPVAADTNAKL